MKFIKIVLLLLFPIGLFAQGNIWQEITLAPRTTTPTLWNGKMWYDNSANKFKVYQNGISMNMIPSFGSASQIPFMNSGATDYQYSDNINYKITPNTFRVGNNISISTAGTNSDNFYLGNDHIITSSSGTLFKWNYIIGDTHTVTLVGSAGQDIEDCVIIGDSHSLINEGAAGKRIHDHMFSGSFHNTTHITSGANLDIFGGGHLNGSENLIEPTISTLEEVSIGGYGNAFSSRNLLGGGASVGGFMLGGNNNLNDGQGAGVMGYFSQSSGVFSLVHGYVTTYANTGGLIPSHSGTVARVLATGKHAMNFSANSPAQTSGFGALADYSGIFGGFDHHIPSTSPQSMIFGGSGIVARASDPNQVYVPNLNINSTPVNTNSLTQILARDATTGRIDYVDKSTIGSGGSWLLSNGGTLSGANTINGTTSNTIKYLFNSLGTTLTDGAGLWLQNSTSASSGNQQRSPSIVLDGQGFGTTSSTSQSTKIAQYINPIQGTVPNLEYVLASSINNAAYNNMAKIVAGSGSNLGTLSIANIDLQINGSIGPVATGALSLRTNNVTKINITNDGKQSHTNVANSTASLATLSQWTPAAHTNLTLSTEVSDIIYNLNRTVQWATGTLTTQRAFRIQNPTYAFVGASTITDAATFEISGSPIAGTNATITRTWAARILGNTSIGGSMFVGDNAGTTSPTALLHLSASTTSASTASLKINEGTRQTTPEDGTLNYVSNNLEFVETSTVYILAKTLKSTATLDFPNTANGSFSDLTITLTGVVAGDPLALSIDNASVPSNNIAYTCWVSSSNTISIRFSNNELVSSVNPASGSFTVSAIHY